MHTLFPRTISYIDDNKREEYLWQSPTVTRPKPVMAPPALSARDGRVPESSLICTCSETPLRTSGARSYLVCAETCLDEIFLDVAEDEMEHYAETMRLISWLDPVQAEMLAEEAFDAGNETADRQAEMGYRQKSPGSGGCRGPPRQKDCPPFNASPRHTR